MPKNRTYPTLYDEVKTITVTELKKWGYLQAGNYRTGVISWSRHGRKTGSISIAVNLFTGSYLEFDYKLDGQPIKYTVPLVSIGSNLGKGEVWYFMCPHTQKRCRTLYLIGSKFLHREAYTGCMYESQTKSHKDRALHRMLDKVFGREKLIEQLYTRGFPGSYAGRPTKRFLRLQKRIKQADSITFAMIKPLLGR